MIHNSGCQRIGVLGKNKKKKKEKIGSYNPTVLWWGEGIAAFTGIQQCTTGEMRKYKLDKRDEANKMVSTPTPFFKQKKI